MASTKDTSYGNANVFEKIGVVASLALHMPFVLGWTILTSPFHRTNKHKNLTRVIGDKVFYHVTGHLNIKQLQWALGDLRGVYEASMKAKKYPIIIDELPENSRLLWLGERRTERVILYLHGGAYIFPMASFVPNFWDYIIKELKAKHKDTGLAFMQYSLVPTGRFPTQLTQCVHAIHHLLSIGVEPQNIQLAGDSAGANLILKIFSHMLHPIPEVPRLTLSAPFAGACLISPWTSLSSSNTPSMNENGDSDIISKECLSYWGKEVLAGVPEEQRPYLEATHAPDTWFAGLDKVVDRLLITAGDRECLRDDIVVATDKIRQHHPRTEFVLQEYGVHNDPFFNFSKKGMDKGKVTPVILKFFDDGFKASPST